MKKVLLSLIALLGALNVNAQQLSIADFEILPGQKTTFPVLFSFSDTDKEYRDFELHITFPEGITVVDATTGNALDEKATAGTNTVDGDARFTTVDLNGNPAKPGVVWNITIEANASMAAGTYEAKVTMAQVGLTDGKYDFTPFNFNINVTNTLVLDENSEVNSIPDGATADVIVKRTIKAGQWSTVVLPFTLPQNDAKNVFGDDVQLCIFDSFSVEYEDDSDISPNSITVNFKNYTLGARSPMTGGTPYLIKTSKDIESIEANGVTLVSSPKNVTKSTDYNTNGIFVGTFVKSVIPEDGLFISEEKFWYSKGKTNTKAFRGWFMLDEVLDKDLDFGVKLNIFVDGEETAIDNIQMVDTKGAVYTVDGKFVGRDVDQKKLQKGVYIIDGKKVAIK